jgi:hypothetical protein
MTTGSKLALIAAVLLAGCHGEPKQAPAVTAAPAAVAPVVKRGPTPEELTVGMVEAVTSGKSTAAVTVKFDLPQRPAVGKRFDVVIAVLPQTAARPALVPVLGSQGLHANFAPINFLPDFPGLPAAFRSPRPPTACIAGPQRP